MIVVVWMDVVVLVDLNEVGEGVSGYGEVEMPFTAQMPLCGHDVDVTDGVWARHWTGRARVCPRSVESLEACGS